MTATERPRFRTDLVAAPVDDGGLRFVDVHDPDSGNGFRFFEVEYSIACAMDGERDVAGLVRWAREELGVEPSPAEVGTVITTLGELGYLEGTGAPAYEPELVPGVIAAPPERPAHVEDVELGFAGAAGTGAMEPMPAAADVELGTAGATAPPPERLIPGGADLGPAGGHDRMMEFDAPTPPPAEMPSATLRPVGASHAHEEDGPTNLPQPRAMDYEDDEVSVDLSDHLAISASDVKEAVRASKVMAAVDVPKDVLEELEASEARARDEAAAAAAAREAAQKAAEEVATREAAAQEAERREALAREEAARAEREAAAHEQAAREAAAQAEAAREAAEREAREQASKAKDLPAIPVGVSKKKPEKRAETARPVDGKAVAPVETPKVEPRPSGARRALWLLLILAIVLAGAYYYWTKIAKKPLPWESADETTAAPAQPTAPVAPPQPEVQQPPPPPPPPTAALAEKPGEVSNIVAGQVGVLSFVIADGTTVAVGDPVLRFAGNPADERRLEGLNDDIERRYPKQIEAATKALDKATRLNQAAAVKANQTKIDEVNAKLQARLADRTALQAKLDGLTIKAPIAGVVKLAPRVAKGTRTTADQQVASVTGANSLAATFQVPEGGKTYTHDASVRVAVKATPDQKVNCTVTAVDGRAVTVTCPPDSGLAPGTELILE